MPPNRSRTARPPASRWGARRWRRGTPDTGAAGTTNPRSAAPAPGQSGTAVVPPRRGQASRIAVVAVAVVVLILLVLVLT